MSQRKTLEEIQKELSQIEWYYDQCKMNYCDWYLQDKMRYGKLINMKNKRVAEKVHKEQTL